MRFTYSHWRHGGWYVHNVRYPSGAIGCVSNNYADRKWRIACDPRAFEDQPTFKTREAAALAEMQFIKEASWKYRVIKTIAIGSKPSWYGQYRSSESAPWRTAASQYGMIHYTSEEYALAGAKVYAEQREAMEAHD